MGIPHRGTRPLNLCDSSSILFGQPSVAHGEVETYISSFHCDSGPPAKGLYDPCRSMLSASGTRGREADSLPTHGARMCAPVLDGQPSVSAMHGHSLLHEGLGLERVGVDSSLNLPQSRLSTF